MTEWYWIASYYAEGLVEVDGGVVVDAPPIFANYRGRAFEQLVTNLNRRKRSKNSKGGLKIIKLDS